MPTTKTVLFPPPFRGKLDNWLLSLQNLLQLRLVDTSGGNYAEALPAAGLNSSTGQSNQNQELIYKKISADGNTFTLTGSADGLLTLSAQNAFVRLKSNGTSWYKISTTIPPAPPTGTQKFASTIGDGVATSFVVNHALATTDVIVQVHQLSGLAEVTAVEIQITDANHVTIVFAVAPAANDFRVVVIG